MTVDLDTVFTKLAVSDDRLRVLNLMELLGFDTLCVNYSGGGDSGSVENFEFHPAPETKEKKRAADFVQTRLEETLSQPIWDHHGSFADGGGYSVDGSVIWNVKDKMVDIQGTHHYYEYGEDGEETENSDEEWSEGIYQYDEGDEVEVSDYDCDCLLAYAQCVLKGKFPGEYHNRIVAAAIRGDKGAVEYVKWVESGCK